MTAPLIPTDITLNISPTPLGIVLGRDGNFRLSFSNSNTDQRAYNLSAQVIIPNGLSYANSSVTPDSVVTNIDNTITIIWTNIKDLAPNEVNYLLNLTLTSDKYFRGTIPPNSVPVPFDTPISSINVSGSVDSKPRGNDDIDNEHITKTSTTNFIPQRYGLTKSAPGKMPKGAALPTDPGSAAAWPYEYTLEVVNNTREDSTEITLIDILPNGVRYLNTLTVTGALIAPDLLTPTNITSPPSADFVTLNWTGVTLPANSFSTVKFNAAIYDNYTVGGIENSGPPKIPHGASMINNSSLDGASGLITSNTTTAAMDALINKSMNPLDTDVGSQLFISLNYQINQYNNVSDFTIVDVLPDGTLYATSPAPTIIPDSVVYNILNGTTTITWNLGIVTTTTNNTIDFYAAVLNTYVSGDPVKANDVLTNNSSITGTNVSTITPTPDSSSASAGIIFPTITKIVTNYYYNDGITIKPMSVAAPGDLVEFMLTYDAVQIDAVQFSIEIDEYPPLNMGPLSPSIAATYTSSPPFTTLPPVTVAPNGLRWNIGTFVGNTLWTATFKVPVQNIDFVGTRNNLAKLAGINTAGFAYSDRSLALVTFGAPDVSLTKGVAGLNVNAIKAGETYTYTINIANPQNEDNTITDAFEMDFADVIPTGLTYIPGTVSVSASLGTTYTIPSIVGQNVSMTVSKMPPDGTLELTYSVTVNPTVGSGASLTNTATLPKPYSQSDRSYQYPGSPLTASTTLRAVGVGISKLGTPNPAKIGDTVTYIISVTVPAGTTAYNLIVTDSYPSSSQLYIGNATRNGIATIPTSPPPVGSVAFPVEIVPITATTADITLTYSFDVRVTAGLNSSPYSQIQVNTATVNWNTTSIGSPASPVSTPFNLTVITPFIRGVKNQRNVTTGGPLTSSLLTYTPGDVIEYTISLTNQGVAPAYNISLADTLDSFLSIIIGSITVTTGSYSYIVPTLNWTIPFLAGGNSTTTITFSVNTLPGIGAFQTINNNGIFTYNSNNNGFGINYGPTNSNTVQIRTARLTMVKTSDINQGKIGDVITYTLTSTVPLGTIGYKVSIEDTLPTGQTYVTGSALLQVIPPGGAPVPITPDLISIAPSIRFTGPVNYDASLNSITIIVVFQATIVSATHNSPFAETQTNSAFTRWAITAVAPVDQVQSSLEDITAKTPNITVLKQQKVNSGSYTTNIITNVLPGDTVTYKLTVTSNGAAPAYNVVVTDLINSFLNYAGVSVGPTLVPVPNPLSNAGSFTLPLGNDGTLTWTLPLLYNGDTATLEVSFTVNPISGINTVSNGATFTYRTNDPPKYFVSYNSTSNTVAFFSTGLILSKEVFPLSAAVGDTVLYTLTITVPNNIYAYNLTLEDVIPASQQYVIGSALRDGGSGPVSITPSPSGNSIIFTDPETTILGPRTIIYTFNALILTGNINSPYTEIQTNSAIIKWRLSLNGTLASPATATATLDVLNPHLISLKEQRILPAGIFTTDPLIGVIVGNQIEYQITLTNDGASNANSLFTTDVISPYLTFIPDFPVPNPDVSNSVPPGTADGTITWNPIGAIIPPLGTLSVILKFDVNSVPAPGTMIINEASTTYRSNPASSLLGPASSNKVSFEYTLPRIEKSSNKNAIVTGGTVTYTIKITIPKGSTAYNVRVQDDLQSNQTYANNYTKTPLPTGPLPTVTPPFIYFDPLGDITAPINEDVVITYTYDAILTAQTDNPEEIQTNEASILWDVDGIGTPGATQTDSSDVYVTKIALLLEKAQRNFTTELAGPPYYTQQRNANASDIILYELKIKNNTNLADFENPPPTIDLAVYNITLTDILDSNLRYLGIFTPPTTGSLNHVPLDPLLPDGVLTWVISTLAFGATASVVIFVEVLPGVSQGSTIPNLTNAVFSVDNTPLKLYDAPESNEVLLNFEDTHMTKTGSVSTAKIGETITYTITTTIPQGTALYHFKLVDTLPIGQSFMDGTGTLLITPPGPPPESVIPTITDQTLEFPEILTINTITAVTTYTYSFIAKITSGKDFGDYIDTQTNTAEVTWETSVSGGSSQSLTDDYTITVPSPKLVLSKAQRNVTTDTAFDTEPIIVNIGDILSYKLTIENIGAAPAYNLTVTDPLDIYHHFYAVSYLPPSPPINNMTNDPLTNVVTWTIEYLDPNQTLEATFDIYEEEPAAAGDHEENTATATGYTNDSLPPAEPILIPAVTSNTVKHLYKKITIAKTANPINVFIGSTIHYTIQFTLAKGTFAYNVLLTDVIPIGQSYVANSGIYTDPNSGSIPLEPTVLGQLLTILNTINIPAHDIASIYTYTFDALVNSAVFDNTTHIQTQRNNTTIQWKFNEEGTQPIDPLDATDNTSTDINISAPLIIEKYQRNINNSNVFTKNTIEAIKGDIIEYKIVLTNTISNNLYNINLFDSLSVYLKYINSTYVPPLGSIYHTGEASDGNVNMKLLVDPGNSTIEFNFTVEVLTLPLIPITNNIFATFNPSSDNPDAIGSLYSNTVDIKTNLAAECIIVNKVFSQCLTKKCLSDIKVFGIGSLLDVRFYKGNIIDGSIELEAIPNSQSLYNVRYLVSIDYSAEMYSNPIYYVQGTLPPIEVYGVMYIPKIEPTSEPLFIIDTFTELLQLNNIDNTFTVGVYIVNSVAYTVQLFIAAVDHFSFPHDCIPYVPPYVPPSCELFMDDNKFITPSGDVSN